MSCAIKIDNGSHIKIENCKIIGFDKGIDANNVDNIILNSNMIQVSENYPRRKLCYCGSGKLYKNCCGRNNKLKRKIGISVKGNNNLVEKNILVGEGVLLEGDYNKISDNKIILTDDQILDIIKELALPVEVPCEYVREVLQEPKKNPVTKYKLFHWLKENGFDAGGITSIMVSLLGYLPNI